MREEVTYLERQGENVAGYNVRIPQVAVVSFGIQCSRGAEARELDNREASLRFALDLRGGKKE
ncbi:hypothetical protein CMI48_03615 [Candidatus Pacearchaeota archaeon]|jgi:hypothetical protein|nr:hypothetical protein [Candidatus Pacearchaeota archaeon]|tara:strand:- start:603 stop:791 length:189 start_codon:yes stop_codon:yes gene_type:complete